VSDDNFYDILGVDREAGAGTIRKAWRRRTDKAGPGTEEFRRLNEAAETLLDPRRRLEYDASLPPDPEDRVEEAQEGVGEGPATPSGWLDRQLVATVVVGVLAVVAAVFAGILTHEHLDDQDVENARAQAINVVNDALPAVLSYDYRHMASDEQQAETFLTPAYRTSYARNFALLTQGRNGKPSPVQQTKTVVTATVLGAGVMDASPDQVHVMAFVNQRTAHHAGPSRQACSPSCVLTNRVEVTLVKQDGSWLVSGLNPK
jgi:hypothetical protein